MFMEQSLEPTPIKVRNSQEEIAGLTAPVAPPVERQLRNLIDQEAAETGLAHRDAEFERLSAARQNVVGAARSVEESEAADEKAHASAEQSKNGSGWQGALFGTAAAVCFGAEFALTLVTLPYILGLHQWSFLGVVLAIAPTTAVLVLDKVLARLVEDPWAAIDRMTKGWRKGVVFSVMTAFMIVLGAGNLWTVGLLADAREHATVMRRQTERRTPPAAVAGQAQEHRSVVKQAVWSVSIFVTLDGALFSLLALSELRRRRQYRNSHRAARVARTERDARRGQLAQAQTELASREQQWAEVDRRVQVFTGRYREERLLQLEKALATLPDPRSGRDTVTSILTGQRPPQRRVAAAAV